MSPDAEVSPGRARLILLLLALLVLAGRAFCFTEAFEWDITNYALTAREWLAGRALYADHWDIKPPAVYLTYAAAQTLAGTGPLSVFLLNVLAALATLLGVDAAGRAAGARRAGLWAAAFWTVLSLDPLLQANQPNTEVFMNACLAWSFALLVREDAAHGVRRSLAVGALGALASLYKHLTVITSVLFALAHGIAPPDGTPRRRAAAQALLMLGVLGASWLAVLAVFALEGHGSIFLQAVFLHNRAAAGSLADNLLSGLAWSNLVPPYLRFLLPGFAATGLAAILGWRAQRRFWLLLLAWMLSVALQIPLPGRFYAHYYQLWLPPLAIGLGTFAVAIAPAGRVRALAGPALLAWFLLAELPYFAVPIEKWPEMKYGEIGRSFVAARDVAATIDAMLLPEETFFHWGYGSGLHYWSGRRLPSGVFYFNHFLQGPRARDLSLRTVRDLERAQPELVVVSPWAVEMLTDSHPVVDWFQARYVPLPAALEHGPFRFLARRDGRLDPTAGPARSVSPAGRTPR